MLLISIWDKNKLQKGFTMNIDELDFDSTVDVVNCLNNNLMIKIFANYLVEIGDDVYRQSKERVSGMLLEKQKKKYINIDINIVIRAITLTLKTKVTDKNKLASIDLLFKSTTKERFKNLRFVLDYFALIDLCPNVDKTYLYSTVLCENETKKTFFLLNAVGFSRAMILELTSNTEVTDALNEISTLNDDKIIFLAYGGRVKAVADEMGISLLKIIEISDIIKRL